MPGATVFTTDIRLKKFEDRDARVERIEQKLAMYCGAACAAMIADRYEIECNQADAYAQIHNPQRFATERLYSDPAGLSSFMQSVLPAPANAYANILVADDLDLLLGAIVHNLAFAEFPPALLVQRGNHWIVCDGVRLLVDSSGARECVGLFFENPWFNQAAYTFHPIDEVKERWITANSWGVTWLNKFVIIGAQPDVEVRIASRSLTRATGLASAAASPPDAKDAAVALSSLHGFASAPIAGGGAMVTEPTLIRAEDGSGDYYVVPLDATADKAFADFVYVAVSAAGDRLHEITHLEHRLQIPDDAEALTWARTAFPNAQIAVEPGYLWTNDFRCMSRFSVYRRVRVDGAAYRVFASGELVSDGSLPAAAGG